MLFNKKRNYFAILFLVGILFVVAPATNAAPKDLNWINANVQDANSRLIGSENACKSNIDAAIAAGQTPRNQVNSGAYATQYWLSPAGQPGSSNSLNVPVGTTQVNLQLNNMLFVCAVSTQPTPSGPANVAGNQVIIQPGKYVTATQFPNDRPIERNSSVYGAARREAYGSVVGPGSVQFRQNDSSGALVAGASLSNEQNVRWGYVVENDSRYSMAGNDPKFATKKDFNLNLPATLAPGRYWVNVSLPFKYVDVYHQYGTTGTPSCRRSMAPGDYYTGVGNGWDSTLWSNGAQYGTSNIPNFCLTMDLNIPAGFYIDITPPPSAAIVKNVTANVDYVEPGETINFTYSLTPTSITGTNIIDYSVSGHVSASNQNVSISPGWSGVSGALAYNTAGTTVGTVICATLNASSPTATFSGTDNKCVTVVSRPSLKVFGGNALSCGYSGSSANTEAFAYNTPPTITKRGTGAEYAFVSCGPIENLASRPPGLPYGAFSGINNPTPKYLTFANNTPPLWGGNFGSNSINQEATDYANKIITAAIEKEGMPVAAGPIPIPSADGVYGYNCATTCTISSGAIGIGINATIIIHAAPDAIIEIGGNITRTQVTDANQVSTLKIIIETDPGQTSYVNIHPGATQVYASLIAPNSVVNTCKSPTAGYTTPNSCVNSLSFVGFAFAKDFKFHRIGGATARDGASHYHDNGAEVFYYDLYQLLGNNNTSVSIGKAKFNQVKNLPPIY